MQNCFAIPEDLQLSAPGTANGEELAGLDAETDALWVQLACARCAAPCELVLSGLFSREAEKRAWCDKCSSVLGASLRPTLATGDSNVLCHIDATNASVADVPRRVSCI